MNEDFKKLPSNLQPLEGKENIRKGNRYIGSPDNRIEVEF